MEYCCDVWAGAPSCYWELFDKPQKRICRTVGPLLAASIEPLAHCQNMVSLSFFISITLVDVLQNWLNWFHFLFLKGNLLVILIDCMIFLSPFLDVAKISMSTVSFLAQLDWNSLPIECFPLTYDLHDFKSRINRHVLTVCSF